MLQRNILSKAIAVLCSVSLGGCGVYTPLMELDQQPHVTGFLANRIVGHVKCELGRAILDEIKFDEDNTKQNGGKRHFAWLDDWAGTLTITMQVDEKSSLSPGLTWNDPLPKAQTFSLGLGGAGSADATRKQQVDYIFNIRNDFINDKTFRKFNNPETRTRNCEDGDAILIESDLRIKDWLDSALFPLDIPHNVDAKPPDVLTDDLTFVVSFSGNITPTWKLVRSSINPSSPLFSATRTRTNEALIALGPPKTSTKGAPATSKGPSQTVLDFRNISLIGSALNVSIKTP